MDWWTVVSASPEETRLLGRLLGERVEPGQVVLLSGPLGAGKTCFAQGVGTGLGVPANAPVTSPSYGLMNIHSGRLPLYHFDLYRLSRIDDLGDLGYDEFAEGGGLTLVEWADRMAETLAACLSIEIVRTDEQQRRLSFSACGEDGHRLLRGLCQAWENVSVNRANPS